MSEMQDNTSSRRRKVGQSGGGITNSNRGSRSKKLRNSGRSKKVTDKDHDLEAVGELGLKKNKSVPKKNKVKPIKVD